MGSPDFSNVRAVYFDLDDTLCGYWDACKAGLRATFEAIPVPGQSTEQMVGHWAREFRRFCPTLKKTGWLDAYLKEGEPTRNELMRLTLESIGVHDQALARELGRTYGDERNRALRLFPGALETLQALQSRYPLGLITNGPADIQRQEIETLGIGHFFQNVFIEGEQGQGKPHASVFAAAALAVDCEPRQLLFVGNSYDHDMRPAIEYGWRTVWIRRPSDVPPSAEGVSAVPEERPADGPVPDAEIVEVPQVLDLLGIR